MNSIVHYRTGLYRKNRFDSFGRPAAAAIGSGKRHLSMVQVVKKIEVTAFPNFVEHTLGDIARVIGTISSTGALLGMICNGMILEAGFKTKRDNGPNALYNRC